MKHKFVGIVIFVLVATTVVSATNINVKETIQPTSSGVDVPVWEVGDSWTYNFHSSTYKYLQNGTLWYINHHNCTTTFSVTDDTGDNYTVKMTSTNNEGRATISSYRLKFTMFTKLTGEFVYRKTDLGFIRESWQEKGLVFWLIGSVGFPIPAQYKRNEDAVYSPAGVYLPFPLTAGTNGTIPGTSYTYQEKCSLYWGLITLIDNPVKNYSLSPRHYHCEMANITVPKGSYNAYNVSVDYSFGLGHFSSWRYYAPELGWEAKVSFVADWDSSGKPGYIGSWELVSTTYTP